MKNESIKLSLSQILSVITCYLVIDTNYWDWKIKEEVFCVSLGCWNLCNAIVKNIRGILNMITW